MGNELVTREDFGGRDLAIAQVSDSTAALAARASSESQARFVMALKRPRDSAQARSRILAACKRPRFAESALFSLPPRGDSDKRIEGLSIRAAEEFLRCWGNLQARDEVVHDDENSRVVRIEVIDLETNASVSRDVIVEKKIERKYKRDSDEVLSERQNSKGKPVFVVRPTADELLTRQYSLVSKALRTCVLRLIPADILEEAIDLVRGTLASEDAKDPLAASKALLDWFADKLGIQPSDLSIYLGHPVAQATKPELKELRELGTAIHEGHTKWAEALAERVESRRETRTIDVTPNAPEKAKRAEKTEKRQAENQSVRARIFALLSVDGLSQAEIDAEIKQTLGESPTDEQLEAWLARGCR